MTSVAILIRLDSNLKCIWKIFSLCLWNEMRVFEKPSHSKYFSERSHTGFCGQKRTFEVMMTKKIIGESGMNWYLRDRNENSRSIFNFAHFTSWYGLCQKSYLWTCQRKRGYYEQFRLKRTSVVWTRLQNYFQYAWYVLIASMSAVLIVSGWFITIIFRALL